MKFKKLIAVLLALSFVVPMKASVVSTYDLYFDGSGNKVIVGSPISLGTTLTISCFLKPNTQASGYGTVFSDSGSVGLWYSGSAQGANDKTLNYYYAGDHFSTSKLTDGVWNHIAVVINSGSGTFYINGLAAGTFSSASSLTGSYIGQDGGSDPLKAYVDDLRIYTSALTSNQIAQLAAGVDITGTQLYYKFDEGSGTTATDSSGNSNTGTITGATYNSSVSTQLLYPNLITMGEGSGISGGGPTGLDTTGATLLVATVSWYTNVGFTSIQDNKSNVWIPLSIYSVSSAIYIQQFYAISPTVGSSHNFSITANFGNMQVQAFTGGTDYDAVENGASSNSPGSITPNTAGDLLVTSIGFYPDTAQSVNSNFSLIGDAQTQGGSGAYSIASAYMVQSGISSVNPSWTGNTFNVCNIAAFKTTVATGHIKSAGGVAIAHIKSVGGVPIAHVKTIGGVTN